MIIKNGVDIVDISRIEKLLESHEEAFLNRTFTINEINYCNSKGVLRRAESFAACFAAKEAASKALGTGIMTQGIGFLDFEVSHEDNGCPQITLLGKAKDEMDKQHVTSIAISMSHDKGSAIAFCSLLIENK